MERFLLALVTGLLGSPSTPPTVAITPAAAISAASVSASSVYRPVEDPSDALNLSRPPASRREVAAARAQVRYRRKRAERGKFLHRFTFPDGTTVEFKDRPKRPREQANRKRIVFYSGTQTSAGEPDSTFEAAGKAAGLSLEATRALRFISRHEGGFDAINTWDSARFSWGFIQFAGGFGLRPCLAHLKEKSPELFRKLLADYGVDVLPGEGEAPVPVYVSPRSGNVLRGDAAEQAYGDDPLVIALFIRAGRVPEIKQRQIEAAIRDYAGPAMTATYRQVRLSDVLRSPQSLAMLIDRKVQEGHVIRLEWALEHACATRRWPGSTEWPRLEAEVLDLAVRDADARANIRSLADTATEGLLRAAAAVRCGQGYLVPNGPSLAAARAALTQALQEADYRMVVSHRRDQMRTAFAAALAACDPQRVHLLGPNAAVELEAVAAGVRDLTARFRFEYAIRNRLRDIRTSSLPGPAAADVITQ